MIKRFVVFSLICLLVPFNAYAATTAISGLPAATNTTATDTLVIVQSGTTRKATKGLLLTGYASTSHASTHLSAGSDELDGDKIDIDFTPSNFTPSTGPAQVDSASQLTAYLYGIDVALASVGSASPAGSNGAVQISGESNLSYDSDFTYATASNVLSVPIVSANSVTIGGVDLAAASQTLTNKTINSSTNDVHADTVHAFGFNNTGSPITKGSPVYVSGYNIGSDIFQITPARADDATKMPCFGVAEETIAHGSTGMILESGILEGVNTSAYSVGDALYVAPTGGLTATRPTGTNKVQKIAQVVRSNIATGAILLFGAGRANDLPNLPSNEIWIGDSTGVATEAAISGIDLASFSNVTSEFITSSGVTFDNLSANGDIGASSSQVASGIHASAHVTGQADEIDGDKLDIDWNPSNYTPATNPVEADSVDNLTAHLYGIDQALSSIGIAGTDTQVLFNDGGTEAGDTGLTYNKTSDVLTVSGGLVTGAGSSGEPHFAMGATASPTSVSAGDLWRGAYAGTSDSLWYYGTGAFNLLKTTRIAQIRAIASSTSVATISNVSGDFRPIVSGTIVAVGAYVDTAGGGVFSLHVLKNGATILSTPIWLDATEKTSQTAATAAVVGTPTLVGTDVYTASVSQVMGTAPKGLVWWIKFTTDSGVL